MSARLNPRRGLHAARRSAGRAITWIAGAASIAASAPTDASDLRMTVEKPRFTCERASGAKPHPTARAEPDSAGRRMLPCCDTMPGCAQFLPTSTVLHAPERLRS